MKKYSFSLIFLAIASVAVIMFACKKENESQTNSNGNPAGVMNQNDEAIINRLVAFNRQVHAFRENPAMKTGETMTIEEATANIGDLFNVVYGQATESYTATASHEFTLTLPLTAEGEVWVEDVASVYEQAVAAAREAFLNDGFTEDKGYISLAVETEPQRDGSARLKFHGTSGKIGVACDTLPYHPFDTSDYWQYAAPMGKCDYSCQGDGADKVLERAVKPLFYNFIWMPSPRPGGHWEFVDHRNIQFNGPQIPNVFYREQIYGTCIDPDDMNLYLNGELEALLRLAPDQFEIPDYHALNFEIEGKILNEGVGFYYHQTRAEYARLIFVYDTAIAEESLMDY
ncbi:MAG: hypothetical protein MJZ94_04850 [Bacteroidales bacterium]|nr:hypothetical protein [Bacteroidales bacterium]